MDTYIKKTIAVYIYMYFVYLICHIKLYIHSKYIEMFSDVSGFQHVSQSGKFDHLQGGAAFDVVNGVCGCRTARSGVCGASSMMGPDNCGGCTEFA